MAIIIEGIDNSGKSTLAEYLSIRMDVTWVRGEGPPKYPGEMAERLERYFQEELARPGVTLYDRHPCVSQTIYGTLRSDAELISEEHMVRFASVPHTFIYCDPGRRGLAEHQQREGIDTEEHMRALEAKYNALLVEYRKWALKNAHIIYRIGDNRLRVLQMLSNLTT